MFEVTKPGPCQVGSRTDHPCLHLAVVEIRGVLFCEPCARRQEAYFAIGELTRGKQSLRGRPLAEALNGLRRERDRTGGIMAPRRNRSTTEETGPRSRPGGVRAFSSAG